MATKGNSNGRYKERQINKLSIFFNKLYEKYNK